MEGISHLEPLEHSVLNAARDDRPGIEASVFEPLEHGIFHCEVFPLINEYFIDVIIF